MQLFLQRQCRGIASGPDLAHFLRQAAPNHAGLDKDAGRPLLLGMDKPALISTLKTLLPRDAPRSDSVLAMRASQIEAGLYSGISSFDGFTSLPAELRELLKAQTDIGYGTVKTVQQSEDGTRKFLFEFAGTKSPARVETVLIPAVASRRPYSLKEANDETEPSAPGTICVSSQAGCALNCAFCCTGTQPLQRNLSAGEILAQIMGIFKACGDFPLRKSAPRAVTNVVFMGQGEPLLNYRNVSSALDLLLRHNLITSPAKIIVSTSGIPQRIPDLADHGVGLALSLHSPIDSLRNELVPINKTYPLQLVIEACRDYLKKMNERYPRKRTRMTLEYVMLAGVNDSTKLANEVVKIVRQLKGAAKVNLLPFNSWPGSNFVCSSDDAIRQFADVIRQAGVQVNIRTPRGRDISAACGQLKTSEETKRRLVAQT